MTDPETGTTSKRGTLAYSTAIMALGTLLSRVTGFGRIFAMGYALSFTRLTDTYNLANNAPNIIYELIMGGVLSATLVPVFVQRFNSESEDDAWKSVSAIFTLAAVVLIALTFVLFLASPWIIDLYTLGNSGATAADQKQVATDLLRMFSPQVAVYGFISIATGLLLAKRKFGPPMFAPILNNIVVICVLFALPHIANDLSQAVTAAGTNPDTDTTLEIIKKDPTSLLFLGLGTTLGVIAMGLLLVPYVAKLAKRRLRWYWNPRHPAVKSVLSMSGWTAGFVAANQIALWITLVLANGKNGDLTAFLSAYTFFILPHGIFTVSVVNALQPEMAERWTRSDIPSFRNQIGLGLRIITVVIVPSAIGYAILALPITNVILQHGHLTDHAAHVTGTVLAWMLLGLPGFSAFIFLTRAFQSMQDAKTVFYLYLFENAFNVVTAVILYNLMGVNGLGLSQSASYTVATIAGLIVLRKRIHGIDAMRVIRCLLKVTIATAGMAVATYAVMTNLPQDTLMQVISAILTGIVTYAALAYVLRISELRVLLRPKKLAGQQG